MPIITLTTDLGLKDYYVGSLKGKILSEYPEAQVVDISHEIQPFDILQASIILRSCYRDFPEGTVHLVGINPDASEETSHIVVKNSGHYFILPDNGMASLIFDTKHDDVVEIGIEQQQELITFPAKDIYVKAACHIARGGSMQVIGKSISQIKERVMFRAVSEENVIRGMALYIDHYGNVLTNVDQTLFGQFNKFSAFSIQLRRSEYTINHISKSYSDVPEGEKLALFSSSGLLEIAINQGNASQLLGIRHSDIIRIEFYDH